jgi:hypothetical protein
MLLGKQKWHNDGMEKKQIKTRIVSYYPFEKDI